MTTANTDFGVVAQDLQRAAGAFALLTTSASAFGSALGEFREFERQLTLTNAIAGGTVTQFEAMKEAARSFSLQFTTTANEAGQALQQLAQAGFTAQESLQSLSGVLLLAQATFTDIGTASDLITSNIRAFKLEAADTTRIANVLAAATTSSLATIDKLAFAFRQVAPVAELANLSIEETTALLNQLFNVGLRGEQAGTALRNIIIRLVRPLGEAQDILRNYGIATRNAAGDLLPLVDIFNQLREAGVTNAELARIFETEALAGVVTLLDATAKGAKGAASAYEENLEAISGTDRALEIAVQNLDTFDASLKLLSNTIADLKKDIGEDLAGPVQFLADSLREIIETFRGLPQGIQTAIQAFAAFGFAVLGSLAAINALSLLLGGVGLKSLGKFVGFLFGAEKTVGGVTKSAGLMRKAFTAIIGVFAGVATSLGPAIAALGRFIGVAISLTPQGRIIRGLVTLGGLLAATSVDWTNWGNSAEEALNKANAAQFDNIAKKAAFRADDLIPDQVVNDLEGRVAQIRAVIEKAAETQTPIENIGTGTRQGGRASQSADQARSAVEALEAEFSEIENILRIRDQFQKDIAEKQAEADQRGFIESLTAPNLAAGLQAGLDTFLDGLSLEARATLETFDAKIGPLQTTYENAQLGVQEALRLRTEGINKFISDLSDPETSQLTGDIAGLEPRIREILADTNVIGIALRNINAISGEDIPTPEDFVVAILQAGGGTPEQAASDAKALAAALNAQQIARTNQLTDALTGIGENFDQQFEDARVELLKREVDQAKTVAEAVTAARAAGLIELENNLDDLGADNIADLEDLLNGFTIDNATGYDDAVKSAFANSGINEEVIKDTPGFAELMGGQVVIDAINARISESTTDEQAQVIIEEEFARMQGIMAAFIENIAAAGLITPDQISVVQEAWGGTVRAVIAAAINELNSVSDAGDKAAKSTATRLKPKGGGKKGKSAADLAKEALRDARKIEDAFTEAGKAILDAKSTFAENAFGLNPGQRASDLLGFDIEKIEQDFDKNIQRLERKLEDLELDFKGSPSQLAELQAQTREAIRLTEQAKQAEIDAATSFEAQMKRRSEALDTFIRDLRTVAFESGDTFTKVSAGIGVAFAEYNKDLVTLVDITSNAVTGFLEATTTGIADFIFENENAWDAFKSTMLDISREIFEGFTKSLIQQSISSLTDGGGSILGNILQPGAAGGEANGETPSVGTGGLLGGLFGGAAQGQGQGGVQAQPIQAGIQQVAAALTAGATQIQGAVQQLSSATSNGGLQQRVAADQAANETRQGGQATGSALNETANTVRSANSQIASAAGAGGGTGSAGGGLNFTSLLTTGLSLFGFAKGGLVSDKPINNYIRNYANGGKINGPGTGTSDDILAFLSNGEFVNTAKATSQFQPVLEALNEGDTSKAILRLLQSANTNSQPNSKVQAYANGGLVGDSSYGSPAINLTQASPVLLDRGNTNNSNTSVNNSRGGDTININVRYVDSGGKGGSDSSGARGRRSADQLAQRIGAQIQRAKKNT